MKTTVEKTFDAVKYMREQRDRLSKSLSNMTKEEIVEYFKSKKLENSAKPRSKKI
ncbi:MAG: hypothetical protein J0L62_15525 [Bacteroidetes bacterium]|nr:hypothetical protein [Bacteroidota bacterium]